MADSPQDPDSTPPKPRGLWSLMGTAAESEVRAVDASERSNDPPSPSDAVTQDSNSAKNRGLWGLMGQAPVIDSDAPPPTTDPDIVEASLSESEPDHPSEEAPTRRGLFALMQRADKTDDVEIGAATVPSSNVDEEDESDDVEMVEVPASAVPDATDKSAIRSMADAIDLDELEAPRYRLAANQARRQVRVSLISGVAALLASGLSYFPNAMSGVPATVLGFGAIIAGYLAVTGPGRREISATLRGVSIVGMLLGTVGIFLGPTLIAGLGRTLREANGQQGTRTHLEKIGEGLEKHYLQHDAYPVGGTFARTEAGVIHGQHGWMTFLLPFVGEAALHQRIDLGKPFDDLANRNVMGTNIPLYFAAGGDRSRIGDGFAVSHFAGVGGEISDANGLAHLGIFERDAAVKRDEITDGLSSTLIVGELAGTYPPWGDPENWRKIGRGLNKDVNGFGSYSGKGAMFLLADGTVRFFSNKTDPKLLEKMSTRDGAEPIGLR